MVNSGNWVMRVKEKCVSYTQKPGNSRPESSVDLRGAKLHWANELSSKKNVFKVRNKTPKKWNKDCKTCKKLWQTCGFILLKSFSRIFLFLWSWKRNTSVSLAKCSFALIHWEYTLGLFCQQWGKREWEAFFRQLGDPFWRRGSSKNIFKEKSDKLMS